MVVIQYCLIVIQLQRVVLDQKWLGRAVIQNCKVMPWSKTANSCLVPLSKVWRTCWIACCSGWAMVMMISYFLTVILLCDYRWFPSKRSISNFYCLFHIFYIQTTASILGNEKHGGKKILIYPSSSLNILLFKLFSCVCFGVCRLRILLGLM